MLAAWTVLAWAVVRGQLLARRRWQAIRVPRPPASSLADAWVVRSVLRRLHAACLPRTLVLQEWLATHGDRRDVVLGVATRPAFRAHAWLAGDRDGDGFEELTRRAAPAPRRAGARPRAGE